MLARPELRQLAQRITARYHLTPLDASETGEYLRHRWRVAGGQKFPFEAKAVQRMHRRSGGVPRLLNVIAERALLAGYARDATAINAALVDAAANEVLPPAATQRWWPWLAAAAGLAAVVLVAMQWRTPPVIANPGAAATDAPVLQPAKPAAARTQTIDAAGLTQLIGATGDTPVPAWQALLAAWKLPAGSITVDPAGPCVPAARTDVHCLQGRASLTTLLALDRPVLLRVRASGADAWALLLGADARRARLRIGARRFDIDRLLLQSHWNGEYVALWVGTPPSIPLASEVIAFQSARGLPADGVAGPLTLMALAGDAPGPRLLRELD
jgi:general secretion pathway protein A